MYCFDRLKKKRIQTLDRINLSPDMDIDFLYDYHGTFKTLVKTIVLIEKKLKEKYPQYEDFFVTIEGEYESSYFSVCGIRDETDAEMKERLDFLAKMEKKEAERKEKERLRAEKRKAKYEASKAEKLETMKKKLEQAGFKIDKP